MQMSSQSRVCGGDRGNYTDSYLWRPGRRRGGRGQRSLRGGGGAKDTINAQNFKSNSVDIKKRFFPERSAERISPEALAALGRNAPLGAAGPAARS